MKQVIYIVDYLFYKNGSFIKACKVYKFLFVARLAFWLRCFDSNNYEVNLYKYKPIDNSQSEFITIKHYQKN